MKTATLALIQRVLAKLNEKSSIYGYLMLFGGYYAQQHSGEMAHWAAITSALIGVVLFALNDPQVRSLLTVQKAADPPSPTVPAPFDSDKR